jgi:glycine betaine/proline transport system substrate-binding protein
MMATAAFATLIATSAFAADLPGKGITVKPAQSTISEESFQTLLVSRALEKLGYTVEKPSEVDYNVAYTSIAAGDTTFIATNWQPLHDDMYAAAGGDNKFYRKGVRLRRRPGLSDRQKNRRAVPHHLHRSAQRSADRQTV